MDATEHLLQQAQTRCDAGAPSVGHYADLASLQHSLGLGQPALANYVIATLLQATLMSPLDGGAWLQLGLAFNAAGREDRAAAAFRAALLVRPAMAEACNNLGSLGQGDHAVTLLRRAVLLSPERGDYHTNLAHCLLAVGRWEEGFRQWEWRTPSPPRDWRQPRWQGEDYRGRTLLVHAEQGYGDSIQFARYLPQAAALGGRLLVETRAPLAGLLARLEGVAGIALWGAPLPPCDLQISLPSLAAILPMPGPQPYLSAPRHTVWRQRLAVPGRRRIGLVWSGSARDPRRVLPYESVTALAARLPHHQFFGLQRDATEEDGLIRHMGKLIADFDDLAAALSELDLLISIDTAAAHLAGALGLDVRVLLPATADWRWWGPTPDRSAWYPSARLYRQERPGDWSHPLEQLINDLD